MNIITKSKIIDDGHEYEFGIILLTPELAQEFLDNMLPNRKKKEAKIKLWSFYQENMIWESLNGSCLLFNNEGQMWDGQNRCLMVIKSKIPYKTFYIKGINPNLTTDSGTIRSVKDIFDLIQTNCDNTMLATVIKYIYMYDIKKLECLGASGELQGFTKKIAVDLFNKNELNQTLIKNALRQGDNYYSRTLLPIFHNKGLMGFYCYILPLIDTDTAKEFMECLIGEISLGENTPISVLHEILLKAEKNKKNPKERIKLPNYMAMINKCWNLFIVGARDVTKSNLIWKYNEKYPYLKDINGDIIVLKDLQNKATLKNTLY